MSKAAANLIQHAGIEKEEALKMCSLYPARVLGMEKELGMIAGGYKIAMVALDDDLNVKQLITY
jgi:N-acetylglucosamine-6-phosphate deacetylase